MTDHKRQRKLWYIVGGIAILGFIALGATAFMENLTPYVSFADAQRRTETVQVKGALAPNSTAYAEAEGELRFGLVDEDGHTMPVAYRGVKPGNFEEATEIVAVGRYTDGVFHAEQLLVKCPSKYQGIESNPDKHRASS